MPVVSIPVRVWLPPNLYVDTGRGHTHTNTSIYVFIYMYI